MGKNFGVTFLGLWWAEFHAEKEMGAKMVGLRSYQKIRGDYRIVIIAIM